ncbi:hypothetical protein HHO41_03415 [Bacillus sp. DNRA2]|nr:hypothetical protein [Bacillus sp. DNRA2]
MISNKTQYKLLKVAFLINFVILIPLIFRKKPIKDWIIVYLFNAVTNEIIDKIVLRYRVVKYPIRLFPKVFKTHILFDLFIYPTFTIFYNQITYKDKLFPKMYKLLLITIPPFLIELCAERKTELIKWTKKWKWYYSFLSIIIKSFTTRMFIDLLRWSEKKIN